MTSVSFIVPCRDKAPHVAAAVRSVLAQTYAPMEILLSDQGSEDDTRAIVHDVARSYNGPNQIRLLDCPYDEARGMAGLNAHLNWLNDQATGDIVIMSSSDDINHPERAAKVVAAFEEHDPSYVGNCMEFLDADYKQTGFTAWRQPQSGWVTMADHLDGMIGGSSAPAWRHEMLERYPLQAVETEDMVIPFFSILEKGFWYIHEPLYGYIKHADGGNAGLEGVARLAKTDAEKLVAQELVAYHMTYHFTQLLRRAQEMGKEMKAEDVNLLANKILQSADHWARTRTNLTMTRLEPMGMKV